MGSTRPPRPPKGLGRAGKALFAALQSEYGVVDAGGVELLATAARCADLEHDAMQMARAEGLALTDRYGQRRPHPCLSVARDARAQKLMALRQLNLDVEPLHERAGRPGGGQ